MRTIQPLTLWLALASFALFASPGTTRAADTRLLPFQGRLTDAGGNSVPDGSRVVQFKLYDAPVGGRAVWNGEVQNLTINAGLVSTLLGTKASLSGVDFDQDLYLELTIDANADGQISLADPPLLPRQSLFPAAFAKESADSRLLDGYDWSSLFGTNNPADGTLLNSKIADASLTAAKLADGSITSAKLPNGAVTRPKLDTTGASSGQALMYDGTNVVWSKVDAVNAELAANAANANTAANALKLNGFDWSTIFTGADPAGGTLSVQSALVRGTAQVNGDFQIGAGAGDYKRLILGGGNSFGYLYGSFPALGDGIHLAYNHYYDAGGVGQFYGTDGPTSRLTVGYGVISLNVGGVGVAPETERVRATTTGVIVRGTFSNLSDRNAKQDFSAVNTAQILEKVVNLPLSQWSYKEDPATRHLGPMSQDFYSSFRVGTDEKHISPLDEGGVAFAAIQGLNTKVEAKGDELRQLVKEQQEQIEALKAEIIALKSRQF